MAVRRMFLFASVAIVLALLFMVPTLSSTGQPTPVAYAAAGPCPDKSGNGYHGVGPDCTGFDPEQYCADDAITVASMGVVTQGDYAGQLDLRYSPSCKASWGRFTNSRA